MNTKNYLNQWKVLVLAIVISGVYTLFPTGAQARPSLADLQAQIDALQGQVDTLETEIGVNWMGKWDFGTQYELNDAVSHNGASYIATEASLNVEPPDLSSWDRHPVLMVIQQYQLYEIDNLIFLQITY